MVFCIKGEGGIVFVVAIVEQGSEYGIQQSPLLEFSEGEFGVL